MDIVTVLNSEPKISVNIYWILTWVLVVGIGVLLSILGYKYLKDKYKMEQDDDVTSVKGTKYNANKQLYYLLLGLGILMIICGAYKVADDVKAIQGNTLTIGDTYRYSEWERTKLMPYIKDKKGIKVKGTVVDKYDSYMHTGKIPVTMEMVVIEYEYKGKKRTYVTNGSKKVGETYTVIVKDIGEDVLSKVDKRYINHKGGILYGNLRVHKFKDGLIVDIKRGK